MSSLSPPEVQERARQLATWWASHRPDEVDTVARLFHDAGDAKEAIPWFRRAFDRATQALAGEAMLRYFRWWAELTGRTEAEVGELLLQTEIGGWNLAMSGAFGEALELVEAAQALPVTDEQRWFVELGVGDLMGQRDAPRAAAMLARLRGEFQAAGEKVPEPLRLHLQVALGSQAYFQGHCAEAVELLSPVLERSQDYPLMEHLRVRIYIHLADALVGANRPDEARALFQRFRSEGLDRHLDEAGIGGRGALAGLLGAEGGLLLVEGNVPAALETFQKAIDHLRGVGSIRWLALALELRAEALLELGDLPTARAALEEARSLSERFDLARQRSYERLVRALAHLQAREWSQARPAFEQALKDVATLGGAEVPLCRLGLARVLAETGDPKVAMDEFRRAEDDLDHLEPRWRPQFFRFRARVRLQIGDAKGARADLEKGLEVARLTGNRLGEGYLLGALGRWEKAHGDDSRGDDLLHRAATRLHECGVDRDPWALGSGRG